MIVDRIFPILLYRYPTLIYIMMRRYDATTKKRVDNTIIQGYSIAVCVESDTIS